MKQILLSRIQVRDSERMIGEREAEGATSDGNWTKVKGGNAGVGGVGSDAKKEIKEHTKRVLFEPIHSKSIPNHNRDMVQTEIRFARGRERCVRHGMTIFEVAQRGCGVGRLCSGNLHDFDRRALGREERRDLAVMGSGSIVR